MFFRNIRTRVEKKAARLCKIPTSVSTIRNGCILRISALNLKNLPRQMRIVFIDILNVIYKLIVTLSTVNLPWKSSK